MTINQQMIYRGRFAPSPSGPLHFGSLVAAMGSYLDAKKQQGKWLVRIEDIDPPREKKGAASDILNTLEAFGFEWDEDILYQSQRIDAYQQAIDQLNNSKFIYECVCSRSEISAIGEAGIEGTIYPGTCRNRTHSDLIDNKPKALRVITTKQTIAFTDHLKGRISQNLAKEIGDFVIKRADGLFAYQLAVVVDDAFQSITDVVRGTDLLTSTPRQIYLQQLLGVPTPHYKHLPLVMDKCGKKLSKQSQSHPVEKTHVLPALMAAWRFLHQPEPPSPCESINQFWDWAIEQWNSDLIYK